MIYLLAYLLIGVVFAGCWMSALNWKHERVAFFAVAWLITMVLFWWAWCAWLIYNRMFHSSRCAWCGQITAKDEDTVRAHILVCEKHPMRAEIERYRKALGEIKGKRELIHMYLQGYELDEEWHIADAALKGEPHP